MSRVTSFQIVGEQDGKAIVAGRYTKLRGCGIVGSQWYKNPDAEIEFERLKEIDIHIKGEGLPWGPILLNASPETAMNDMHVIASHKCHPLWVTKTKTWPAPKE